MKLLSCGIFWLTTFATPVWANQFAQTNIEIDRIGSQGGQVFYLSLKEGFRTDCAYGVVYCPIQNESCKYFFSMALATKMAGKKLFSIDYSQDPNTKYCAIDMIQIN